MLSVQPLLEGHGHHRLQEGLKSVFGASWLCAGSSPGRAGLLPGPASYGTVQAWHLLCVTAWEDASYVSQFVLDL